MSKRTHQQQLARARQKRSGDRLERRERRSKAVIIVMVLLLVLSLVGAAVVGLLGGGGDASPTIEELEEELAQLAEEAEAASRPPDDLEPCPAAGDTEPPQELSFDEPPLATLGDGPVRVTLVTTCGEVVLELDGDGAPTTVANFVGLAESGFYDGTTFHRTDWDFVIQGGDPAGDGAGSPGYEFADELETAEQLPPPAGEGPELASGLVAYPRGTLAMANRGPDTNGSQFFIVQADPERPFPPLYTVFGRVVEGMDVVDRIAAGPSEPGTLLALEPVVVLEVRVERDVPDDDVPDDDETDAPDDDAGDAVDDDTGGDDGTDDEG